MSMGLAERTGSMTESTVRRRRWVNEPGEQLLLDPDPFRHVTRFDEFATAARLPVEKVLSSPICTIPIPVPDRAGDGTPTRWAGADPSWFWHPLLWLPARLAFRYMIGDPDQPEQGEVEPDDMWAARVCLEMVGSGLYNPDDGTWLDVAAYYGLDTDNPVDQARITAWLEGAADPDLDRIDLEPLLQAALEGQAPDQVPQAAADLVETLQPAQWSLTADVLGQDADVELNGTPDDPAAAPTPSQKAGRLTTLAMIAAHLLRDVPPEDGDEFDMADLFGGIADEAAAPDPDTAVDDLAGMFLHALGEIRDDYRYALDALDDTLEPARDGDPR